MRDTLATLAVRASVPEAERLSLLPFTVGNLAGFHIDDVLPGRASMLLESVNATKIRQGAPRKAPPTIASMPAFCIAAMPGGPAEAE